MNARATKKPRPQGRPDAQSGVGRQALVDAAIEELRTKPPEALTVRGVAARANADPALIRYYFGSKDGLLLEVVHALAEQSQEAARSTLESDAPLQEKMSHRLKHMIELVQSNPYFHRLVLDKVYKDDVAAGRELLSFMATRGMHLTASMLYKSSASEALRSIDPRFLHVALIGLAEFYAGAEPLLRELFTEEDDMEKLKQRYVAFLSDLLRNGLTAKPE